MGFDEWGVPGAIYHLGQIYKRLEKVRRELGKFVSYEDEARDIPEAISILTELESTTKKIEDTVTCIEVKIRSLLKEVKPECS